MAMQRQEVGIKVVGSRTEVGNDPISRLQYYLACMRCLLPGLEIPDRFFDYGKDSFPRSDLDALLQYSEVLSPDRLDGEIIFRNDELNCGNEFVELSVDKTNITVVESLVIAGKQKRVAKIMMYTGNWMNRNYHAARREIRDKFISPRVTIRFRDDQQTQACIIL